MRVGIEQVADLPAPLRGIDNLGGIDPSEAPPTLGRLHRYGSRHGNLELRCVGEPRVAPQDGAENPSELLKDECRLDLFGAQRCGVREDSGGLSGVVLVWFHVGPSGLVKLLFQELEGEVVRSTAVLRSSSIENRGNYATNFTVLQA